MDALKYLKKKRNRKIMVYLIAEIFESLFVSLILHVSPLHTPFITTSLIIYVSGITVTCYTAQKEFKNPKGTIVEILRNSNPSA